MIRRVIGIVIGCIVAIAAVSLIEWVDSLIYPLSRGTDPDDPSAMAALVAAMPLPALLIVAAGWFLGSLAGGATAQAITRWRPAAWIVAGLVLVGSIVNFATIAHPAWMVVTSIVLPLAAPPAAIRLAGARVRS